MEGEQTMAAVLIRRDVLPRAWYGSSGLHALSAASPGLIGVAQRS